MPFALFEIARKTGIMASWRTLLFAISLRLPVLTATMAFFARDPFSFHQGIVKEGRKSALQGSFTIRSPSDRFDRLDGSPWSARAWVHQRSSWHHVCYTLPPSVCSGNFPRSAPVRRTKNLLTALFHRWCRSEAQACRSLTLEAFSTPPDSAWVNQAYRKRLLVHDFWHLVFRDYPKDGLTYSGNRLIATSGLAKETQDLMRKLSITPFEYVAGLWMFCFSLGLLWYVSERRKNLRLEGLHAPTWSWASVKREVGHATEFTQGSKKSPL